jgi:hypothetical protein
VGWEHRPRVRLGEALSVEEIEEHLGMARAMSASVSPAGW